MSRSGQHLWSDYYTVYTSVYGSGTAVDWLFASRSMHRSIFAPQVSPDSVFSCFLCFLGDPWSILPSEIEAINDGPIVVVRDINAWKAKISPRNLGLSPGFPHKKPTARRAAPDVYHTPTESLCSWPTASCLLMDWLGRINTSKYNHTKIVTHILCRISVLYTYT